MPDTRELDTRIADPPRFKFGRANINISLFQKLKI